MHENSNRNAYILYAIAYKMQQIAYVSGVWLTAQLPLGVFIIFYVLYLEYP